MTTILIVFGVIELVIIGVSLIGFATMKEIAALIPLALLIYGSALNAVAFLLTMFVYDHVNISLK